MEQDPRGEKALLISCFAAGFVVGYDAYGLVYGALMGVGFAVTALMISEFLGELVKAKPIARYGFVALAAFMIFKVLTDPTINTRGGRPICVDAGRFGQERCLD